MPAVAALLERRPALLALRRALPRGRHPVRTVRTPAHLAALLHREAVDAVVLGLEAIRSPVLAALRAEYATIPVVLYAALRADDAALLLAARRARVAALVVEGLDEPVLARRIGAHGLAARRAARLLPLGPAAGLSDPFQRAAWALVVAHAPERLPAARLAAMLGVTRTTLVRRFGAGGAPPLKRATDLVRLVAAAQLLGSRAYTVADAAALLGFSSPSLLHRTARRLLGAPIGSAVAASDATWLAALRPPTSAPDWT